MTMPCTMLYSCLSHRSQLNASHPCNMGIGKVDTLNLIFARLYIPLQNRLLQPYARIMYDCGQQKQTNKQTNVATVIK